MNYIGSKFSLLDFIDLEVSKLTEGHTKKLVIGDLFAGTGAVGLYFRNKGHQVIANDIQHYSYVVNYNLIKNKPIELKHLARLNALEGVEGFIYKNYCYGSGSGRMYFSDENGKKCDAIRQEIERLYTSGEISEAEYYAYLSSLIEAIDKVANTASVYGAFLKQLKKSAQKQMILVQPLFSEGPAGDVYNEDVNKLITKIEGDILYLDPPYNARQYSSNYHMLETISKYDNPVITGKTGLRDATEQKSKYSSKRSVLNEFEDLVKNAKFKYVLLSYNNEGLMPVEEVQAIMEKYGTYTMSQKTYRRFKADKTENRNHKYDSTTEYLHILKKKA